MASSRIVITASGVLTALGRGMKAQQLAISENKPGLRLVEYLETIHAKDFLCGEVRMTNTEMANLLGLSKAEQKSSTRTALLAMVALSDLLGDGLPQDFLKTPETAFINANTVGGMSEVENYYTQFIGPDDEGDFLAYIDTLDCAESTEKAAEFFGLNPFMATISTACSSSGNAMLLGARLIKQGVVKNAICGGCDALSRFTLNGFNSLKNLDRGPARPFSNERMGLNLGEGAAYLLLEKEEDALARGAKIIAIFAGGSNSNDAYHPTAPSPDGGGAIKAMHEALIHANLTPEDIGYINAHGTATFSNDVAEGRAIEKVFDGKTPFSSTKPFTGHTLAAAAAVEAIICINTLHNKLLPANLNYGSQMPELNIAPITETVMAKNLKHVVSNSFGFGGNNVSLIFSEWK